LASLRVSIEGGYSGKDIKLVLMNYETRKDKSVSVVSLDGKNSFSFSTQTKEAAIYNLLIADSSIADILLKPNDKIILGLSKKLVTVSGSLSTQYLLD
jgi:hypothetical protein